MYTSVVRFQSALPTTTRVSEVDITNICPSPESHVHSWVTFLFLPSTTTRDSKGNHPAGELLSNTSLTLDKSCANFLGCSLSSKMTAWTNPPRSKGPGLLYSHMGYRELYFSPGPRYAPHYCLLFRSILLRLCSNSKQCLCWADLGLERNRTVYVHRNYNFNQALLQRNRKECAART